MKLVKRGVGVFMALWLTMPSWVVTAAEWKPVEISLEESISSESIALDELETPSESTSPDELETPSESTSPDELETPSESTSPDELETPSESTSPDELETPSESTSPDELETPSESTSPDELETPSESTSPDELETPSESTSPDELETPSESTSPDESETPSESTSSDELEMPSESIVSNEEYEQVQFNTGNRRICVVDKNTFEREIGDAFFEEDGSYIINIPEENPFFPYEVQFTYNGEIENRWFMTPDDSVEIGEHTFYVSAYFDDTVVTQMSLNVGGDTLIVYPEEKTFIDGDSIVEYSLLPLKEVRLTVDLTAYTPAELTMVLVESIFTGSTVLKDTDKVVWKFQWDENYEISSSRDVLDLSYRTEYGGSSTYEIIVGDANQLAADNIRYIVNIKRTGSEKWISTTICTQDSTGMRGDLTPVRSSYDDYNKQERELEIYIPVKEIQEETQLYLGLNINNTIFPSTGFEYLKVYEGEFTSAAEAMLGTEITDKIWSPDMTQPDTGYSVKQNSEQWITIITFDLVGNVTGCLPVKLQCRKEYNYISFSDMYAQDESGSYKYIEESSEVQRKSDGYTYYTSILYSEYPADGIYYQRMQYYEAGEKNLAKITAAYIGQYSSITEAEAAGAADIKTSLFTEGYAANYSQGVYFTIFVGGDEDDAQEIYRYCVSTKTGTTSIENNTLSSGTYVKFTGLLDDKGNSINSYIVNSDEDSYGENNYLTILVDENVDLSCLAPQFFTEGTVKLYTTGSSSVEVSGVSVHDFSNGAVQYTASAEDGVHLKNYWLQIVKAVNGSRQLYINSLIDKDTNTHVEAGVIYSTRELLLDSYHDYLHDILLVNMGTEQIASLSVELESDTVILDNYWTLNGTYDLSGFSGVNKTTIYGELSNLAKIRIKAKDDSVRGTAVSGTLRIKSGSTVLMVLTLTGIVGDPCITTTEIPTAVKYVPYGTMIQNNNKYSWNSVSYSLLNGRLPSGMKVKYNGELYGVPTEAGEFTFTIRMKNKDNSFSSSTMTYTLIVTENTNQNVENATDQGYYLIERVKNITLGYQSEQTLVSQGTYSEFVDIYLDGKKLQEGEDYNSGEGSTRITLRGETLTQSNKTGTHTLGIEFRTSDTDTLKRAAQNYIVYHDSSDDDKDSSDKGNNSSNSSSNKNNNSNNNASNETNSNSNKSNNETESVIFSNQNTEVESSTEIESVSPSDINTQTIIYYTIEVGDTLWKVAQKFYGSGNYWEKIFHDNADTIINPNKIYAGQMIVIYMEQEVVTDSSVPTDPPVSIENSSAQSRYYTVEIGDTLWKIAKKVYGNGRLWHKIYEVNTNTIKDPGYIYAGQLLIIPE